MLWVVKFLKICVFDDKSGKQVALLLLQWLYEKYLEFNKRELSDVDCRLFVAPTLCYKATHNQMMLDACYKNVFIKGVHKQVEFKWDMEV